MGPGDDPSAVQQSLIGFFEANVRRRGNDRLYTWHSTAECTGDIAWSYNDVAERGRAVCCALRQRWEVSDGARVMLTDAPWCSVFHHCTEK